MNNEANTISVVLGKSDLPADVPEEATLRPRDLVRRVTGPVDISVDQLRASLQKLTKNLATLLADLQAVGGFELAEVQVAVELTASGGVHLIGNLTAGAKGALQLKFKPATKAAD